MNAYNQRPHAASARKAKGKRYYRENKEKWRDTQLKNMFGITMDDYNAMFSRQSGRCATCGIHAGDLTRALCVDHCHDTGRVRGLLCSNCNVAIGNAQDSQEILLAMVRYLQSSQDEDSGHIENVITGDFRK